MENSKTKNTIISISLGLLSTIISLVGGFTYLWNIGEPHLSRYLDERDKMKTSFRDKLEIEMGVKRDRIHIKIGATVLTVDEMKIYLPKLKSLFGKNIRFGYKDNGVEYWFSDGRDYEIQRDEQGFSYYVKNGKRTRLP